MTPKEKAEEWKDVLGYEGVYQVSNFGDVFSCPREWTTGKSNALVSHNGKICAQQTDKKGYKRVHLCINGKRNKRLVHQLVAESFLNHDVKSKLVIDHINDNPSDNRLENLHIVTMRFNSKKTKTIGKYTSTLKGVCYVSSINKWQSSIFINGKKKVLGRFTTEIEAHLRYKKELELL